jgi:hypothetical protein
LPQKVLLPRDIIAPEAAGTEKPGPEFLLIKQLEIVIPEFPWSKTWTATPPPAPFVTLQRSTSSSAWAEKPLAKVLIPTLLLPDIELSRIVARDTAWLFASMSTPMPQPLNVTCSIVARIVKLLLEFD